MHRFLIALVLIAHARLATAQATATQAEVLYRQGLAQLEAGHVAEACATLDDSQRAGPAVTTEMWLAACREKNEQLASAWGWFVDVARQTRHATDDEHTTYRRLALEHAAKLEPILSKLTIEVPTASQVPGLTISRGAAAVAAVEWNYAQPVDGGTYTITASAPGHDSWHVEITIGRELDVKTVAIPRLRTTPPKPVVVKPPPRSPLPAIAGASALVLGGVAVGFEVSARGSIDRARSEADDALQRSLWHSANAKHVAAQVIGVAGVAAAGFAVWSFVRDTKHRRRAIEVAPMANGRGLALGGVW